MSYIIKTLPSSLCEIGKSPYWNPRTESLYYVDLSSPAIFRYDFNEKTTYKSKILNDKIASFLIPIEHVTRFFFVGLNRQLGILEWDGISGTCEVIKILFEVDSDIVQYNNRFNIGKIDPNGRFFGGTMCMDLEFKNFNEKRFGKIYKYQNSLKQFPCVILEDAGLPNGFTWNPTTNKFYYIDSIDFDIKEFDYDPETGDISNEKVFINFYESEENDKIEKIDKKNSPLPDFIPNDIAIDSNGFLYVCGLNNATIYKINPSTGKYEDEIIMPTKTITAITFGGLDMDILYVTTAAKTYFESVPDHNDAGNVFQITGLNVTGIEMKNMKLKLCLCPNKDISLK